MYMYGVFPSLPSCFPSLSHFPSAIIPLISPPVLPVWGSASKSFFLYVKKKKRKRVCRTCPNVIGHIWDGAEGGVGFC